MYPGSTIDSHQSVSEQTDPARYTAAHSFSLRVTGSAMAPEFPEGLILIVDTALNACAGDFVIVRTAKDVITFRQLLHLNDEYILRPINPLFPCLPLADGRIIGVLRESVRRLR